MKHLFIINPAAGKGKALKHIPEIEKVFLNIRDEFFLEITKRPGHATEIAHNYVKKGKYRVYSVGGDGTLNEVVNGIAGSDSSLAVIPCGSGNDFIRSITRRPDMRNIIERTIEGQEKLIDLARVNSKYFINISSMGFDAEVLYSTVKFKKLPGISGSLAYIIGVIATLLKTKNNYFEIFVDGQRYNTKALLVAIANAKYYGGGMMPVPGAEFDDGKLDVCLIKEKNIIEILRFFPKFIKGKHGGIKGVNFYKGKSITVRSAIDVALNIDGEVKKVKEAVFEIIPKGINVVIPKDYAQVKLKK